MWPSAYLVINTIYIGQGKKEKESLIINKNINFQLVSSHARPQGSIFEDGRF